MPPPSLMTLRPPFRRAAHAEPVIRIVVRMTAQLFDSVDPSPFIERDLDPQAERFILDWAHDAAPGAPLALHIDVLQGDAHGADIERAVHAHFRRRADTVTRELRDLMRRGRISAVIGLSCLAGGMTLGDSIARWIGESPTSNIIREGLHLLGWVSTWKPIDIFLYAWWPLVGERRLFDRLSRMPVRLEPRACDGAARGAPMVGPHR